MRTLTVLAGALILLGLAFSTGMLPEKVMVWLNLSGHTLEARIDEFLGKERVMREQALHAIAVAEEDIVRLQDLVATSSTDQERAEEMLAARQHELAGSQAELGKIARLIDQGQPVTLTDGSVWSIARLQELARAKIARHETLQEQVDVFAESVRIYAETAAQAQTALVTAQQSIGNMQAALELLDAKLALLATVKAQPAAASSSSAQVGRIVGEAEQTLQALIDEVDYATSVEQKRQALSSPKLQDVPSLPAEDDALLTQLYELAGEAP